MSIRCILFYLDLPYFISTKYFVILRVCFALHLLSFPYIFFDVNEIVFLNSFFDHSFKCLEILYIL